MIHVLKGLGIIALAAWVFGGLVMGMMWLGGIVSHDPELIWMYGWWPWIFLSVWPVAGVALLLFIAYDIGGGFEGDNRW